MCRSAYHRHVVLGDQSLCMGLLSDQLHVSERLFTLSSSSSDDRSLYNAPICRYIFEFDPRKHFDYIAIFNEAMLMTAIFCINFLVMSTMKKFRHFE